LKKFVSSTIYLKKSLVKNLKDFRTDLSSLQKMKKGSNLDDFGAKYAKLRQKVSEFEKTQQFSKHFCACFIENIGSFACSDEKGHLRKSLEVFMAKNRQLKVKSNNKIQPLKSEMIEIGAVWIVQKWEHLNDRLNFQYYASWALLATASVLLHLDELKGSRVFKPMRFFIWWYISALMALGAIQVMKSQKVDWKAVLGVKSEVKLAISSERIVKQTLNLLVCVALSLEMEHFELQNYNWIPVTIQLIQLASFLTSDSVICRDFSADLRSNLLNVLKTPFSQVTFKSNLLANVLTSLKLLIPDMLALWVLLAPDWEP
jgi:hypothetical protein